MRLTVESVLRQSSSDWLLTVIDDAYQDPTIRNYLATLGDPRVRYIRKEHNEGITENFRSCVAEATQDLMMILGADDLLMPDYVQTVMDAHRRYPQASIIQPGVQVIDEDGHPVSTLVDVVKQKLIRPRIKTSPLFGGEELAISLMQGDWLYWPSLVFRTERIRGVDFRNFAVIQDLALVVDMICRGDQLLVEPTVCFSYRRHSASASALKLVDGSRFEGEREYYDSAAVQAKALGWRKAQRAAKLHITSRLHALVLVPSTLARADRSALAVLLRHALGR
jgi:glycosyltransferase involved in cell wall biosynthesis